MKACAIGALLLLCAATATAAAGDPPILTLVSPLERAVARPYIHVVATCASEDGSGCVNMTVSDCSVDRYKSNPITVPGSLIDLFVQPCYYFDEFRTDFGTTIVYVDVSGVDAAGRRTSRQVPNIGTESSPALRTVTAVDGLITDVRAGRILYVRNYNSLTNYEIQPEAPPEFWIRDVLSPAADEHLPIAADYYVARDAFLTPHGMMYSAAGRLFEWRGRELVDLGPVHNLGRHNERFAVWTSDSADRHLLVRDLEAGVTREAILDVPVYATEVDLGGAVAFVSLSSASPPQSQIFTYRDGVLRQLTSDVDSKHFLEAIDGERVAYIRTSGNVDATILRDGDQTIVLAPLVSYPVLLREGWAAYTARLAIGHTELFLRDPGGAVTQLTSFGGLTTLVSLGADGEALVSLFTSAGSQDGLYLVRPGFPPRRIANRASVRSFYTNRRWYFSQGNTLFEPADSCGLAATLSSGRYRAAGGNGTVAIEGSEGCAWSAMGVPPWISVEAGARGAGNGAVVFTVAPNTGRGRTAAIEIAGQTVTVRQDAGAAATAVTNDFTGGGRALRAVYRAAGSQWWIGDTAPMAVWGEPGWIQVPADYNGDGQIDLAAFAPDTGTWWVRGAITVRWGIAGDVPVPADYDGDGRADVAVFRPATGQWFVKDQATTVWGLAGDLPVPADYDGDGRADVAVFRPSTGVWYVNGGLYAAWGQSGDIPVPADYDGDGAIDIAVYRPATATWYVRERFTRQFGATGDLPVPLDFNGDGQAELAVYRRASGTWFVENGGPGVKYGLAGDLPLGFPAWRLPPVPVDQGGDHRSDPSVYRTAGHHWSVQQSTGNFATQDLFSFGADTDVRRITDFDGDGRGDLVAWRPSTGMWYVDLSATAFREYAIYGPWGDANLDDTILPGDYDGDRKADLMVFRALTGRWYMRTSSTGYASVVTTDWGLAGDIGVPADYDGDGRLDLAVFRPAAGRWYVKRSSDASMMTIDWGASGDVAVPADYDGDGRSDVAIFRPSTGAWWIRYSSTNFTTWTTRVYGASGDVPIPGDYNGDGLAEPAYFRSGVGFFVSGLGQTFTAVAGDIPIGDR